MSALSPLPDAPAPAPAGDSVVQIQLANIKNSNDKKSLEEQSYQFQKDTIAHQLAFLLCGEAGEKAAQQILAEANEQFSGPEQGLQKMDFIKEALKKRAIEVDDSLKKGMSDLCSSLNGDPSSPENLLRVKNGFISQMGALGIPLDEDYVKVTYHEGSPSIFRIVFLLPKAVNQEQVGKLADAYQSCCQKEQKQEGYKFNNDWEKLKSAPPVSKDAFKQMAEAPRQSPSVEPPTENNSLGIRPR